MVSSSTRAGTRTTSTADQRREREVAEIVCPRCGHRNPLGSNFCSSCGFGLSQHPEDTATLAFTHEVAVESGSPQVEGDGVEQVEADQQGTLVVTRGPNVGARIPLAEARVTIGRHPDS